MKHIQYGFSSALAGSAISTGILGLMGSAHVVTFIFTLALGVATLTANVVIITSEKEA